MNSTQNLSFEPLSQDNWQELYHLFKEDENSFVLQEYKNKDTVKNYYHSYLYFRNATPKTTVHDWLIKLKNTGEYVGLLNLYDIIFDQDSPYYKMCSIGYVTAEKFRGKGFTKEAVQTLIDYAFTTQNLECITAMTANENVASRGLLQSLGFKINTKDHNDDLKNKYFELKKSQTKQTDLSIFKIRHIFVP